MDTKWALQTATTADDIYEGNTSTSCWYCICVTGQDHQVLNVIFIFISFQSFALVMAFLPFQRMAVIRSNQPSCIVCKDLFKMVTDDNLFFFSFLTGSELTPSIRHSWLGDAARENIALTLTL